MQVVDRVSGTIINFEPGLSVEVNFIDDCVTKIIARGVGLLRTSNHVEQDIRDGIEEAILALKSQVKP